LVAATFSCTDVSYGFTYSLGVGPVSLGNGGSNPPSLKPHEFQATVVFEKSELVFSVSPGIFYAWRSAKLGPYFSLGPGIVLDANGMTMGGTAAFGYNMFCINQCLMMEFRKAIGFVSGHLIAPYTAKIGFTHIIK
jgi:hypothetical protein